MSYFTDEDFAKITSNLESEKNAYDKELVRQNAKFQVKMQVPEERALNQFSRTIMSPLLTIPKLIGAASGGEYEASNTYGEVPEARTQDQRTADIVGRAAGEVANAALLSAALAPLGLGGAIGGKVAGALGGGKAATVAGGAIGSFAENAIEDLAIESVNAIAEDKTPGEFAQDYGQSLLWDAAIGTVLGGLPALHKVRKANNAANRAGKVVADNAEEAAGAASNAAKAPINNPADVAQDVTAPNPNAAPPIVDNAAPPAGSVEDVVDGATSRQPNVIPEAQVDATDISKVDLSDVENKRQFHVQRAKGEDPFSTQEYTDTLRQNPETYTVKSDDTLYKEAQSILTDETSANNLYQRILINDPTDHLTDSETLAGQIMNAAAVNANDMERALDLSSGLSRKATETARSLRSYGLSRRITPEGTLIHAQRAYDDIAEEMFGKGIKDELGQVAAGVKKQAADTIGMSADDQVKRMSVHLSDTKSVPKRVQNLISKNGGAESLAERLIKNVNEGASEQEISRFLNKALGIPDLDDDTAKQLIGLATEAGKLADDTVKETAKIEEIYTTIAKTLPVTWRERFNAWRKISMLSNPKTHIRNFLSNLVNIPQRKLTDAVAQLYEKFLKDQSGRTRYLGWSSTPFGQSIKGVVEEETERALPYLRMVGKYNISDNVVQQYKKVFGNSPIQKISDAISWSLNKGDEVFMTNTYKDALGQVMTARGATTVTDEMRNLAKVRALDATFRTNNGINDVIVGLKQHKNKFVREMADFIIPFSKTPSNLMIQAFQYSPFGLVKSTVDAGRLAFGAKTAKSAADIINGLAKGTVGTAEAVLAGVLLGGSGILKTNFSVNEKDRAMDELEGKQQYGIQIGDFSISLDWLQPVAFPIIAGAAVGNALKGEDGFNPIGVLTNGFDSIFEMSMLQSLTDLLSGYGTPSENAFDFAGDAVQQFIPSAVTGITRAIDPVQRKVKGDDFIDTLLNSLQNKAGLGGVDIPGRGKLDEEKDIWGNTVYRTGRDLGFAGNLAQQLLNPSNLKVALYPDDITSQALIDLYRNGDIDQKTSRYAVPGTVTDAWELQDGTPITESAMKDQAMSDVGQYQRALADEFISGAKRVKIRVDTGRKKANGDPVKANKWVSWDTATDEEKAMALKTLFSGAAGSVKDAYEASSAESLLTGVFTNG